MFEVLPIKLIAKVLGVDEDSSRARAYALPSGDHFTAA